MREELALKKELGPGERTPERKQGKILLRKSLLWFLMMSASFYGVQILSKPKGTAV